MRAMIWFLLSCKRHLRRRAFLALLCLLPLAALALARLGGEEEREIWIAVCVTEPETEEEKGEESLGERLMEELTRSSSPGGMFRFYRCEKEEQLREEVASRRAECGYVISGDLERRLAQGNYRRAITVYSAPSTVAAGISQETVFAALAQLYDRTLFLDYVERGAAFEGLALSAEEAEETYERWRENGSTFRFEYVYEEGGAGETGSSSAPPVIRIRGLMAVLVFVSGLYGAVLLGEDEQRGLFLPLNPQERRLCALSCLAAPVVLSLLSGLLALAAGGELAGSAAETGRLLAYGMAVVLFSWLMKNITRTPRTLCCVIPFLVVGSLVFSPVFLDVGRFSQTAAKMGYLFLPWYYLRW